MTRPPSPLDQWLPTGSLVALRSAGRWWDAVRVPRHIGEAVLTALGDQSGAVIDDPSGALMYWLIPPGGAHAWAMPDQSGIVVQGDATYIAVPGTGRTVGPHWRIPPSPSKCLTDADPLGELLRMAAVAIGGAR